MQGCPLLIATSQSVGRYKEEEEEDEEDKQLHSLWATFHFWKISNLQKKKDF